MLITNGLGWVGGRATPESPNPKSKCEQGIKVGRRTATTHVLRCLGAQRAMCAHARVSRALRVRARAWGGMHESPCFLSAPCRWPMTQHEAREPCRWPWQRRRARAPLFLPLPPPRPLLQARTPICRAARLGQDARPPLTHAPTRTRTRACNPHPRTYARARSSSLALPRLLPLPSPAPSPPSTPWRPSPPNPRPRSPVPQLCYGLSILGSIPLVILPFYSILLPLIFDTSPVSPKGGEAGASAPGPASGTSRELSNGGGSGAVAGGLMRRWAGPPPSREGWAGCGRPGRAELARAGVALHWCLGGWVAEGHTQGEEVGGGRRDRGIMVSLEERAGEGASLQSRGVCRARESPWDGERAARTWQGCTNTGRGEAAWQPVVHVQHSLCACTHEAS